MKYAGKAHVWVYRRTSGGQVGANWRVGAGFKKPVPTLLLEHHGRKSGKTFVSPLVYMYRRRRRGRGRVAGRYATPNTRSGTATWWRSRHVYVEIGTDRRAVRAETAGPEERARLWPKLVEAYADFDTYQSWADREIPVVVLKPR